MGDHADHDHADAVRRLALYTERTQDASLRIEYYTDHITRTELMDAMVENLMRVHDNYNNERAQFDTELARTQPWTKGDNDEESFREWVYNCVLINEDRKFIEARIKEQTASRTEAIKYHAILNDMIRESMQFCVWNARPMVNVSEETVRLWARHQQVCRFMGGGDLLSYYNALIMKYIELSKEYKEEIANNRRYIQKNERVFFYHR